MATRGAWRSPRRGRDGVSLSPRGREGSLLPAVVSGALAVGVLVVGAFTVGGCGGARDGRGGAGDRAVVTYRAADRVAAPELTGDLLPAAPPSGSAAPSSPSGRYELRAHRGEVVVINFWASWCPPCRDEIAELAAVAGATRDRGVSFVGINVRDDRDRAVAFVTAHPAGYPSLFDPAGESALRFKVPPTTVPATLVVDREGRIAAVFRKALTRDELQPVVERLAAER